MAAMKSEAEIIQWAVARSRARTHKAYPWHELQEIALAMEHGMDEEMAYTESEATEDPLSQTLPSSVRKKHDEARVAQLRALITNTNWAQAEREYDEAKRQALLRPPAAPAAPIAPAPPVAPELVVAPEASATPAAPVAPEPEDPGTRG